MKTLALITVAVLGLAMSSPIKDVSVCPKILSRQEWQARPPRSVSHQNLPVPYVVIHHTVMGEGECNTLEQCIQVMKDMQDLHMDVNGWDDIGYSFVVGGDGSVFEGRGWDKVGAHAPGYNDKSIGISVVGNFMNHLPNSAQLSATQALIACGLNESTYILQNYTVYGHRDTRDTDCPGDLFYDEIKSWPHFHYELENKTSTIL